MRALSLFLLALCLGHFLGCGSASRDEQVTQVSQVVLPSGFPNDIPAPPKVLKLVEAEEMPQWFEAVYECEAEPVEMHRLMRRAIQEEGWKETLSIPMDATKESLLNFEKPDGRKVACQVALHDGENYSTVTLTILKKKG